MARWNPRTRSPQLVLGCLLLTIVGILVLFGPALAPHSPESFNATRRLEGPSASFWLGTDQYGRDILSRILTGARATVLFGVGATVLSATLGLMFGLISGFVGGHVDDFIMRSMDALMAIPTLLKALLIVTVLGGNAVNAMIAVGIATIPGFVRIVRSAVLRVRSNEYVDAARAVGVRDARLLMRYVLPNVSSEIIVTATLGMASAILFAAALSFLGLGAQPPTPEWGAMVLVARNYLDVAPHQAFFPIAAIFVTILGFNFLGDGLRDALDPRLYR